MTASKPNTQAAVFLQQVKTLWEGEGLALKELGDAVARSMRGDRPISRKRGAEIAQVLWDVHANASKEKDLRPRLQRFWDKLGQALNQGSSLPAATGFEAFKKLFLERLGFLPPPAGDDAFDPQQANLQALRPYLLGFAEKHDLIDFSEFIVDQAAPDAGRREQLSAIYVHLDTTSMEPVVGADGKPALRKDGQPELKPLSAGQAVALHRHLVILGDPGAGKSTFVRHLAISAARRDPPQQVPLIVELRDFAAKFPASAHQPSADILWQYIRLELSDARFQEVITPLENALKEGHGLVVLDGLDEVKTDTSREFVCQVVADFAASAYAASRILVTCRTYSYRNHRWTLPGTPGREGFQVVELKPLDRPRIERYLKQLYQRLSQPDKADVLLGKLQHHNLERLAGNPLELFNMALLNSHHELPDNQAELYQQLVELRLFQLDERRFAKLRQKAPLLELLEEANCRRNDFLDRLCGLAFQVHAPARNPIAAASADISEPELRTALEPLHPIKEKQADWAWRVADVIRQRGGLIREEARTRDNQSVFRFPHRNYQEFLASRDLARQRDATCRAAEIFLSNLYWRQVVRWVPLVQRYLRDNWDGAIALVAKLCDPCPQVQASESHWEAVALASDMVEDLGKSQIAQQPLGPECLNKVRDAITSLIQANALDPRSRAKLGCILGGLDDHRSGVGVHHDGPCRSLPYLDFTTELLTAGKFKLGDKGPTVKIKQPYRISRYPVTVAQFQAFVEASGYADDGSAAATQRLLPWWTKEGLAWKRIEKITGPEDYGPVFQTPNHPRVGVSWYEAMAFCRWLTARLHSSLIRLPHEAEWEQAARWNEKTGKADARFFPWGGGQQDTDLAQRCNCQPSGVGHTSAVGLFPSGKADCGAMDLSGNVWEWCENWYDDKTKQSRVVRGGSWGFGNPGILSCACRDRSPPGGRDGSVGFRCVVVGESAC